jgi:hypothetical protein
MHPDTREVAKHMREFGLTVLGRAGYQCTFSEMGTPYAHAMAVGFAGHGAELVIKARIADEHPLLIFDTVPKSGSTKDLLSFKELFENGRTIQYNELPEALWAATGIRMEHIEQFQQFGKYRNAIMHFAVAAGDWSSDTLEFLMEVMEPLVQQFWGESLISYIDIWDEVTVSEGYFEAALNSRGIEITPAIRAAIDNCIPDSYKDTYKPK